MSSFAVLLLCIQACLVQNVFGYGCSCGGQLGAIAPVLGLGAGLSPAAACGAAAYGGAGEGNVVVIGELPVAGNTAVGGQVPIMGAVNFCGTVPACGAVSITGKCACDCGCHGPYY